MATSFVQELKRRNVFRVAIIYFVVSWLLMQIGDVMFPALLLPEWTSRMLIAFLILGMPIALVFAWAYEVTPDGIKRTVDVTPSESITNMTGRRFDFLIIGILVIAVALLTLKIWTGPDSEPVELALDTEKSIAVLPFKNLSADQENAEFFAAGVHDELLTLLSKIGDLKVISRTSVERLDPNLGTTAIGELLGVATVLEGQVQRAGNQLRINVQLIKAADDSHVWANIYDRELTAENVFAVQSDIAKTIATALHAQLSDDEEAALEEPPTRNTEALEHFMLAGPLVERGSFDSMRRAARHYEDATDLDADYAEAWVKIAHTKSRMYQTGMIGLQEYIDVAGPAISRAIELAYNLPAAQAELATLLWQEGDDAAAEDAFKSALDASPADPQILAARGNYLRITGRSLEAVPVLEKALELDPLNVELRFELGKAAMYGGQAEKNLDQAEKILEIDPSSVHGYVAYLQSYLTIGRYDLAWPWYVKAMDSDPEDFELWAHAGYFTELLGAKSWPDRYMTRANELGPGEPATLRCRIHIHMLRDEFEAALAIARDALAAELDDRWFSRNMFLRMLRDEALRTGDLESAISLYQENRPELFESTPIITVDNIYAAADLALLFQYAGNPAQAEILIDAAISWYRNFQPDGVFGYTVTIVYVHLLALKGERGKALDTLREAIDSGWSYDWFWHIGNRDLDSIRDEPEFQEIVAQLEAGMATQLEAIHALPDMGELDLRFKELN